MVAVANENSFAFKLLTHRLPWSWDDAQTRQEAVINDRISPLSSPQERTGQRAEEGFVTISLAHRAPHAEASHLALQAGLPGVETAALTPPFRGRAVCRSTAHDAQLKTAAAAGRVQRRHAPSPPRSCFSLARLRSFRMNQQPRPRPFKESRCPGGDWRFSILRSKTTAFCGFRTEFGPFSIGASGTSKCTTDYLIRILNHNHWRKHWRRVKKKKKINGRKKMHLGVKRTHSNRLASSNDHGSSSQLCRELGELGERQAGTGLQFIPCKQTGSQCKCFFWHSDKVAAYSET
ncbi:uncharacterized protein [Vicugna pacos]|uniref:Uncharacterized protein n=1 Tax=Vicugna pacos TaxID=30538 RepID=A0ABM5CGI1_VICPA